MELGRMIEMDRNGKLVESKKVGREKKWGDIVERKINERSGGVTETNGRVEKKTARKGKERGIGRLFREKISISLWSVRYRQVYEKSEVEGNPRPSEQ